MIGAVLFLIGFIIVIAWAIFTARQPGTSICDLVKDNGGYQPISTGNKIGVPPKWE